MSEFRVEHASFSLVLYKTSSVLITRASGADFFLGFTDIPEFLSSELRTVRSISWQAKRKSRSVITNSVVTTIQKVIT